MRFLKPQNALALLLIASPSLFAQDHHDEEIPGLCACCTHEQFPEEEVEQSGILTRIEVPDNLPEQAQVVVPVGDELWTLRLRKESFFGPNTKILAFRENGVSEEIDPGPVRSYLGHVIGKPGHDVSAVFDECGLFATILRPGQKPISIEPSHFVQGNEQHTMTGFGDPDEASPIAAPLEPAIATESEAQNSDEILNIPAPLSSTSQNSSATLPPTQQMDVLEFELGVEIGSPAYAGAYNSNMNTINSVVQAIPGKMALRYLASSGIRYRIGSVIVRTDPATDPISVANGNDTPGLQAFGNYWNANPGEVGNTHDLAVYHVFGTPSGLAWVNNVGTSLRYLLCAGRSTTSWSERTLAHELGHQWNLQHTDRNPIRIYNYEAGGPLLDNFYEPQPRNLNGSNSAGGNHTYLSVMDGRGFFSPENRIPSAEANEVFRIRETKRQFGDLVANPGNIRPFGNGDIFAGVPEEPVTMDVIANDRDANNDVLDVHLLDTVSQRGGTIALSTGTGPGGRNEIIYTAPAGFDGVDFFHYTVCDSTGLTDWGSVHVTVDGPRTVNTNRQKFFYDVGTSSSPLFTGNSDPYERLTEATFGDLSFTSDTAGAIRSFDRGALSGVNAINRDLVQFIAAGEFRHKVKNGTYDILFTIGDPAGTTPAIRFTGEETTSITSSAQAFGSVANVTLGEVEVRDGELNIAIESLGSLANITRIIITQTSALIDTSQDLFAYDLGPAISPVAAGATLLTDTTIGGDLFWSGDPVNSIIRNGPTGNDLYRDLVFGGGTSTLNHRLENGLWTVTLNMGDQSFLHDRMQVRAEGELISDSIDNAVGEFPFVDRNGPSSTAVSFLVTIADEQLNLEFSDNGGADPNWVLNSVILRRGNVDRDDDGYENDLEIATGSDPDDPTSRPILSTRELVAHWPLDESSGGVAKDVSGGDQDATWAGDQGTNLWVGGLINGAAQTNDEDAGGNGEEHFRVADLSSLDGATAFSISLWFSQNVALNNNVSYNGLFMTRDVGSSIGSGSGENWGIALENGSSGQQHIDWRFNGSSSPETDNIPATVNDDWQHVLFVWDGVNGSGTLYQNGQQVGTRTVSTGSITSGGEWRFGDDANTNGREFTGTLDDISVFRDALTAEDASLINAAGRAGFNVSTLIGPAVTAPELTLGTVTGITGTEATVAFEITDDGNEAPDLILYYGSSNGGTVANNWDNNLPLGTKIIGNHTVQLNDLPSETQTFYALLASNSGGATWSPSSSFTTIAANNYLSWASERNLTGGPSGDHDSDGIENLLEYALGLDPVTSSVIPNPLNETVVSFSKGAEAAANGDVTYTLQTSENLQGQWDNLTPSEETDTLISYVITRNEPRMFIRLLITQN